MPPVAVDAIADCVLAAFQTLPAKCKPRSLPNGRREWTILAGVVLSRDKPTTALQCVSLATGMKCLPRTKLAEAKGNVLHDWHAEILALRGFNRWLVDECAELARLGRAGRHEWLRWRHTMRTATSGRHENGRYEDEVRRSLDCLQYTGQYNHDLEALDTTSYEENPLEDERDGSQAFALQPNVKIHLYISAAPCGDASMELTMSSQEDSIPWTTPAPTDILPGRSNFDLLGIVRRKPARPDAPVTWSKSCSDKLALKQATGVLSGIMAADDGVGLIWPAECYLSSLVLPEDEIVPEAIERCFGHGPNDRLRSLAGKTWKGGYAFKPFDVTGTSRVFEYAKPQVPPSVTGGAQVASEIAVGSNISVLATPTRQEVLINGVLQGRKRNDPKAASSVSRRKMWQDVAAVQSMTRPGTTTIARTITLTLTPSSVLTAENRTSSGDALQSTYRSLKSSPAFADRRAVKKDIWTTALPGWKKNEGDEEWRI